jgi:hypothetical protein
VPVCAQAAFCGQVRVQLVCLCRGFDTGKRALSVSFGAPFALGRSIFEGSVMAKGAVAATSYGPLVESGIRVLVQEREHCVPDEYVCCSELGSDSAGASLP